MSLMNAIKNQTARVGVIGLGYVGLPLAITAATRGFPVTGFDVDPGKMEQLSAGKSYIGAVSDSSLASAVGAGRFDWTTDFSELSSCDVIIICVPTPLTAQKEPDLSYVETTTRTIAAHMTPRTLVVLESTTFPGTTDDVLTPLLAASGLKMGEEVFVGFSPEREDPGNTSFNTATIPKIVAGDGAEAGNLVAAFYERVVDKVVRVSSTRTAEAVKITENVFRAVNIAMVNELKLVFDEMDIDVWEVIDGAATKPFGFMPFYPGPGLGGHCIPIDPFYLSWKAREYEVPTRFIELAGEINTAMPHHVIDRTRAVLDRACGKGLSRSRILLVGVAYKKNVSDMRESPSMKLMQLLDEAGAEVAYLDPHVPEIPPMREYRQFTSRTALPAEAVPQTDFDAVLIATDHDAIDYATLLELGCPVIDTRNAIARRGLSMERVSKV
ncbi:nucleotide sugar dehydrogenase [uncultured Roseobacter sp.]|uniref:nucleotide sugar dehydrogenase n=1 Tax=uncultured Roseobacter sp. TaxID=114847 RepID=UPI00261DAE6F|nr:nucleotide sugar dehydrogenase [uncultured Roseobacter sp.]